MKVKMKKAEVISLHNACFNLLQETERRTYKFNSALSKTRRFLEAEALAIEKTREGILEKYTKVGKEVNVKWAKKTGKKILEYASDPDYTKEVLAANKKFKKDLDEAQKLMDEETTVEVWAVHPDEVPKLPSIFGDALDIIIRNGDLSEAK